MAHERISNEFAKGGRFRKIAGGLEAKTLYVYYSKPCDKVRSVTATDINRAIVWL